MLLNNQQITEEAKICIETNENVQFRVVSSNPGWEVKIPHVPKN